MINKVRSGLEFLTADNYKAFYLAILRVAICTWLLKDVLINWSSMEVIYGREAFVVLNTNTIGRLPGGYLFIREYYPFILAVYVTIIFLNMLGLGRNITAFFLFCSLYMLQKMNMSVTNNGDVMALLIVFYLVFADSYEYLVIGKIKTKSRGNQNVVNLVSNLAALSIMLQLCLAYLGSFVAKINNPLWFNGEATYYALSMERFVGTPFNQYLVQHKWFCYLTNYSVLAFEMLFPFLIWVKKFRKYLLLGGLVMHLCIYIFMMIYGFQMAFLMIYGLFISNETWLKWIRKLIGPRVQKEPEPILY